MATIQIKRNNSNATTKPSSLLVGELAGNLLDRSLFSSDGSSVFQFYTGTTKWFDTNGNANNANKLGGVAASSYLTGITSAMVTTALDYTPYDSANFTKANIKSTLSIADWALAVSKPTYTFSEITSKPTTLAGYGITDALSSTTKYALADSVGGKALSMHVTACRGDSSPSNSKLWNDAAVYPQTVKFWDVYNDGGPAVFGNILEINGINGHWKPQLWFDSGTGQMRVRNRNYNATSFNDWRLILDSVNYSSYALPLTGGTIKGDLYLDYSLEKFSRINFIDRRIGSASYADEILIIRNGAGVNQGAIGLFGNSSGVNYYYFGHNNYNGNNLRIYSDKVSFGDSTIYHTGNFNPANYLPLSGGTISKSSYVPLVIQNTGSDLSTILFKGASGDLGYLGFNGASNPVYMAPSGYAYTLYHTGNFNPANYLPLSGGTIGYGVSGVALTIDRASTNPTTIKFASNGSLLGYIGFDTTKNPIVNINSAVYSLVYTGNYADTTDKRYLQLSGGTLTGGLTISLGNFIVSPTAGDTVVNQLYPTADNTYLLGHSGRRWSGLYTVLINGYTPIHSGNIGSYNAGSANYLGKSYANEDVNYAKGSGVKMIYSQVSGTNSPIYTSGLSVSTDYSGWQLVAYANPTEKPNPFFRTIDSSNSYPTGWRQLAFLDDNVASATKLQTARTIWGQSFDGTGNVSGGLADVTSILFNTANGIGIYRGSVYSSALTATDIAINGGKIVLNPTGNILIGTTTDNGTKLQVNGSIAITDTTGSSTTSNRLIFVRNTRTDDYWDFGLYAQSTKGLTFFQSSKGVNTDIGYLDGNGNFVANGDGTFGSDARYKSKIQDLAVDIETIANAPVFSYKWTDREDDKVHLGTTAQYWMDTNFKDAVDVSNKDFYHLNYGALGVAIGVSLAKKTINHEERIKALEKENKELKNEIKQLKQWHN